MGIKSAALSAVPHIEGKVGWARLCAHAVSGGYSHAVSRGYFRVGTKTCPPYVAGLFALTELLFRKFQRHIQRLHELINLDGLGYVAEES